MWDGGIAYQGADGAQLGAVAVQFPGRLGGALGIYRGDIGVRGFQSVGRR